jgi:hypothetical protein
MKKTLFLFLFFFAFSCSSSFQDEIQNLDVEGTGLSLKMDQIAVYVVNGIHYYPMDDSRIRLTVSGTAQDQRGIQKVVLSASGGYSSNAAISGTTPSFQWEGVIDMNTAAGKQVCATVYSLSGGSKKTCKTAFQGLYMIYPYRSYYNLSPPSSYSLGLRWHGCAAYTGDGEDEILCFGGEDNDPRAIMETQGSCYDIQKDIWIYENQYEDYSTYLHFEMPESRKAFGTANLNNKIYLMGGMAGRGIEELSSNPSLTALPEDANNYYDHELVYNGYSWSTISGLPAGQKRLWNQAVALNGKIYVMGGNYPPSNTGSLSSLLSYDPVSDSWQQLAPMNQPREQFLSVTDGTYVYVIGGYSTVNGVLDSVERYNPATNQWQTLPSMPTARFGMWGGLVYNRFIYAIGGETSYQRTGKVERYDIYNQTWETLDDVPVFISQAGYATHDNVIYVVGGLNSKGDKSNASYKYVPY